MYISFPSTATRLPVSSFRGPFLVTRDTSARPEEKNRRLCDLTDGDTRTLFLQDLVARSCRRGRNCEARAEQDGQFLA